jgi:ParB family transcriptional regulator, chromosome partitioning protein
LSGLIESFSRTTLLTKDRDLFQPEHEGYLTDAVLLDRLVAEKLEALANKVRAEGRKGVEVLPTADSSEFSK